MNGKRIFLALIAIVGLTISSCKNEPGPGTAEIRVIDVDGVSQKGVDVLMYCTQPGCVVQREGKTNSLGVFTEQFELPVVLRVRAVRYDSTFEVIGLPPNEIEVLRLDSLCGEGFVQIENDEITSETITILECN